MTSFQNSTPPDQAAKPSEEEKKSLRHYIPSNDGKNGPRARQTPQDNPSQKNVAGPNNTLPVGYPPVTTKPYQPEKTVTQQQAPKQYPSVQGGERPAQANNLRQGNWGDSILPSGGAPQANTGTNTPHAHPTSAAVATRVSGMLAPSQSPQGPEIVDGNLILHRSEHFFLRTVYRTGQRANPLHKSSEHTKRTPRVMPNQGQRVSQGETRMIPSVTPINPLQKERFPVPGWLEATIVFIGLAVSFVAHAINMFNFPRYELDEGTYMSSAWSILHGEITPYAYGYGHPPLAWIQIAAWIKMTGGFFTFGNALDSGRVLMILYATGCSLLVYLIVRRLGGNRAVGLLALVIFSLSPLSLTYQREVLLDNVATFWFLLSLYLLVVGNSRLLYIAGSAICFGVAFLSKEVMILLLPGMLYAVWLHTTEFQRKFAMVAFTYSSMAVCSTFVLMAILKGELFPYSWHLPWDTHDHLSMIQTFLDQGKRGQNEGSFKTSWSTWVSGDQLFMIGGAATVAFNVFVGWWYRKQLLLSLLTISYWLLLIRGGVVLSFYLIPLIPLTAINAAMALNTIASWIVKVVRLQLVRSVLLLAIVAVLIPYDLHTTGYVYTQHPTSVQTDAMLWVRHNVPRNAFVIINSYLYTDMHEPGGDSVGDGPVFPYANVYVNVATDPQLYSKVLQQNWDRIDYIVADSEVLSYINGFSATSNDPGHILKQALDHSLLRAQFKTADHTDQFEIQVYEVQHKLPPPMATVPSSSGGTSIVTS